MRGAPSTAAGAAATGPVAGLVRAEAPAIAPPAWFEPYFRQHYTDLLRIAITAGGAHSLVDAEDAVQAVMVRQLRGGKWDHIQQHHAYFSKGVINEVLSEHRRRQRRPPPVDNLIERPDPVVDAEMNMWEDQQRVQQLLDVLPPAQREIMYLIYKNLSHQEIAEMLGKSESTVRSNLRHARDTLKALVPPQTHQQTSTPTGEEQP